MTHAEIVAALCAALDSDDSALMPLADALEEMGDERAAGLRRVFAPTAPILRQTHRGGYWWEFGPRAVHGRLWRFRSNAYLALAAALTGRGI